MNEYDDPYNFNYTTPIKGTRTVSNNKTDENNNPATGFKVFNPKQPMRVAPNNSNNANFSNLNENKFDELQGNIDLDKNAYEKPNNNNGNLDEIDEIPLLEGFLF